MKIFEGKVVSTQMNRTVVVEIFRKTPHPMYRKLIKRSKKYNVDSANFEDITVGTIVKITETKPISKNKYFKIAEIVGSNQIKNDRLNLKSEPTSSVIKTKEAKPKKAVRKTVKKEKK